MAKEKTGVVQSIVTKKDLLYAWFKWFIFSHCCINYERFESLGFTNAISHILAKLYPSKEDLSEALERHQEFFNTEPYIGIVIMGISVAMEEQRAKDGSVSGEAITAVKTGLMAHWPASATPSTRRSSIPSCSPSPSRSCWKTTSASRASSSTACSSSRPWPPRASISSTTGTASARTRSPKS